MKSILFVVGILAIGASSFFLGAYSFQEKTAYVITSELYQGFQGTLEMQKEAEAIYIGQKNYLDSLYMVIQRQSTGEQDRNENRERLIAQYQRIEKDFESKNREWSGREEQAVWKQINAYMMNYGKENGYAFIHGATGAGSLMYAQEGKNITKEVLSYLNAKYEGN